MKRMFRLHQPFAKKVFISIQQFSILQFLYFAITQLFLLYCFEVVMFYLKSCAFLTRVKQDNTNSNHDI